MGGRGSLSPRVHKAYDVESLKSELRKNKIRVVGIQRVNKKNLSLAVDVAEKVIEMNKRHGRLIDTIYYGGNIKGDFSFNANKKVEAKGKGEVEIGRTMTVARRNMNSNKADLERAIKEAYKDNWISGSNIKELVAHELGHAIHYKLKKYDPNANKDFERKIKINIQDPKKKTNISKYAVAKKYNGKYTVDEYVAEAIVHLDRGSRSRKAQDLIDLVWDYTSRVPGVNYKYGDRVTVKTPSRPKKKRKLKVKK